jgi:NADH-quinone oxidoreductase subunit L
MRHMGGLKSHIPTTWAMMLIGTLALTGVGIPGLFGFAGFHSKDAIIEAAYAGHTPYNYAFWALVIAAFMTSFYSWRLMFMTFHQSPRWGEAHAHDHDNHDHGHQADHSAADHGHGEGHGGTPHESPYVMLIPLFVLAVGAIIAGYSFAPYFIGHDFKEFWAKAIANDGQQASHVMHAMHEVPHWVGYAPFVAMLAGFALSYLFYIASPGLPAATARAFRPLYLFFLNKWFFVKPAFAIGRFLWKGGDGAVIDGTIDGTAATVGRVTNRVVRLQTGYVYHYAFAMLIGLAAILTWFMLGLGGMK